MKKRLIAVVAGATMLTSVQVAQAEEATPGTPGEFASHIGEIVNRTQKYPNWNHGTECPRSQGLLRNRSRAAAGQDHRSELKEHDDWRTAVGSSIENDAKQNYPEGTTWDILWGVGIATGIVAPLGALVQGLGLPIPGLGRQLGSFESPVTRPVAPCGAAGFPATTTRADGHLRATRIIL